jgi:hypothetical protein
MKDVGRMLDQYLKRSEKLADAAIVKLQARTGRDQKL